jgi:hypothetical protein
MDENFTTEKFIKQLANHNAQTKDLYFNGRLIKKAKPKKTWSEKFIYCLIIVGIIGAIVEAIAQL